jgi:hypothetical protein
MTGAVIFLGGILAGLKMNPAGIQKPSAGQNAIKPAANYPQLAVYPGALLQSSVCNDAQSMLFRSAWTSPDKVPQIMNWYVTELQSAGWKLDIPAGTDENIQYAEFTRGLFNSWLGKLQLSVEADKNGGPTKIEISFPAPDSEKEGEGG